MTPAAIRLREIRAALAEIDVELDDCDSCSRENWLVANAQALEAERRAINTGSPRKPT